MTVLPRRAFAALAILALVLAVPLARARADQGVDGADAMKFIRSLADQALVLVNDKKIQDSDRAERFRDLFVASFDIPEIGKFVLGRHWKSASPAQQQDFLKSFEDFTVLTWSTRFKDYSGVSFEVLSAVPADDGYWTVDSRIYRTAGDPLPLGWRVHQIEAGWRITDILVEGVSMALTQRQDFASAMQANGGKVEDLLDAMHKKIDELRSGK